MTKLGFFSQFKTRVIRQISEDAKSRGQNHEGRYFAICLREVLEANPKIGEVLFGVPKNNIYYETEHV